MTPTIVALTAFLGSLIATPVARAAAWRFDWIDRPSGHRKHERPTALLGGVAVASAVTISLWVTGATVPAGLAVGVLLLVAVGLWDDRRELSMLAKVAVTVLAALAPVASGLRWPGAAPPLLGAALAGCWLLAVTHAFNLLDHRDGLASGVAVIAAVATWAAGDTGASAGTAAQGSTIIAAAIAGSCAGFLLFNMPRAGIFLGDAGSLPLGLALGAITLAAVPAPPGRASAALFPVVALAVPLFDTLLVIAARLRQGRNPFTSPGTDHIGHRLERRGLGGAGGAAIVYFASGIAGAAGLLLVAGPPAARSAVQASLAVSWKPIGAAAALAIVAAVVGIARR